MPFLIVGSPVTSDVLKQATIQIVSQADCQAVYGDIDTDDTRICVKAASTASSFLLSMGILNIAIKFHVIICFLVCDYFPIREIMQVHCL